METLRVELGERSYPIFIGADILSGAVLAPYVRAKQVLVVTNETIAPIYLAGVKAALKDFQVDVCILPDGEKYKTLETLQRIYDVLLEKRHNRTTTVVALGGGVIGDMAGFAAATYQRGVRFIQVPTTLLSQVDSSVGGKTGVNHPAGKNMIGAFYQPAAVLIDTESLKTLPNNEFAAGMAEVIKYGLIADKDFFTWIQTNRQQLKAREPKVLVEAIQRSCQSKADVVAADEREAGLRATLNLGHTFGHAVETAQGYGNWLHGEAVAAGTVVAAKLSCELGWLAAADVEAIISLLKFFELPVTIPKDMTADQFLSLMKIDKKAEDGRIKLVLLKSIGAAIVTDQVSGEKISSAINLSY